MEDKRLQGLEEGCVVHLLKVENAIVPADAVLLCSGVQVFLGLGHQTKLDASDLIRAYLVL